MKMIMSEKEFKAAREIISAFTEEPVTSNDIMTIKRMDNGDGYEVEIDKEYTETMYAEYAAWTPSIVNSCKLIVSICKQALSCIETKERSIIERVIMRKKTAEAVKNLSSSKFIDKNEKDDSFKNKRSVNLKKEDSSKFADDF